MRDGPNRLPEYHSLTVSLTFSPRFDTIVAYRLLFSTLYAPLTACYIHGQPNGKIPTVCHTKVKNEKNLLRQPVLVLLLGPLVLMVETFFSGESGERSLGCWHESGLLSAIGEALGGYRSSSARISGLEGNSR
jgi:hypothetical protein